MMAAGTRCMLALGVLTAASAITTTTKGTECGESVKQNKWVETLYAYEEIEQLDEDGEKTGQVERKRLDDIVSETPKWTFEIKIVGWRTFGVVNMKIPGEDIKVTQIHNADLVSGQQAQGGMLWPQANGIMLELNTLGKGAEPSILIAGDGVPSGDPTLLECTGLGVLEPSMCPLGVEFNIQNTWDGKTKTVTEIDFWQEGAVLQYDFGKPIGSITELHGATLVANADSEGDPEAPVLSPRLVEKSAVTTPVDPAGSQVFFISLGPAPPAPAPYVEPVDPDPRHQHTHAVHNNPMPKPKFSLPFTVEGLHTVPTITCSGTHPIPPSAPPSLPPPPVYPPPFTKTSRTSCFLGGRAAFTVLPCFGMCELTVLMEQWQAGVTVTLDFEVRGASTDLRLRSIEPDAVVQLNDVTKHSLSIELKNSARHPSITQAFAAHTACTRPGGREARSG